MRSALTLLLALAALTGGRAAAQSAAPPLRLVASARPVAPGETFTVYAVAGSQSRPVAGLFGTSFEVRFDPARFEVTGATAGPLLRDGLPAGQTLIDSGTNFLDNDAGVLPYAVSRRRGQPDVGGVGVVAVFTVAAKAGAPAGAGAFPLVDVVSNTSTGAALAFDASGTGVTVATGAPAEFGAVALASGDPAAAAFPGLGVTVDVDALTARGLLTAERRAGAPAGGPPPGAQFVGDRHVAVGLATAGTFAARVCLALGAVDPATPGLRVVVRFAPGDEWETLPSEADGGARCVPGVPFLGGGEAPSEFALAVPGGAEPQTYAAPLAGPEGWRIFASPVTGATVGGLLGPLWTQGFPGSDGPGAAPSVFFPDEADAAAFAYRVPGSADAALPSGVGATVYVYADPDFTGPAPPGFPQTLTVTGTPPPTPFRWGTPGASDAPLTFTDTAAPLADDGWNVLGNPLPRQLSWNTLERTGLDAAVYVCDPACRFWNGTAGTLENGVIPAFSGFLVKANAAAPTLVVPEMARPAEQAGFVPVLALRADAEVGGSPVSSTVFVQFDGRADGGLDALDAYALALPSGAAATFSVSAPDGTALALSAVPALTEAEPVTTFPLALGLEAGSVGVGGTVTVSWPDLSRLPSGWAAQLRDAATGAVVDLRQAPSYTLTLEAPGGGRGASLSLRPAVVPSDRLQLVVGLAGAVGAEPPPAQAGLTVEPPRPNPAVAATTIAYTLSAPADVVVEVFDVTGRRVRTTASGPRLAGRHEAAVEASALAPGVYVLRVVAAGPTGTHTVTRRLTVAR